MIRTIRAYFLSRALREKLLLVAFVGIGLLWWASAFSSRAGAFWREQRATTVELAVQTDWLNKKTTIEETAAKTASGLDSAKTLNANALVTTVQQLANDAGLKNTQSGSAITTAEGQFQVHSREFTIRNVEWEPLQAFYYALQRRSPYIAMERFILQPINTTGQHTLSLKVASVEITR
jgi:hypothetical protein